MAHIDIQQLSRQAEPMHRLGLGLAAGAAALLVAPAGPTLIAVGLLLALLALIGLDDRRPQPRFTMRRPLVRHIRFEAWRAWDQERDRWCILVSTTPDRVADSAAALSDARRVLRVGPAYDTEHDAHGPVWIFEA